MTQNQLDILCTNAQTEIGQQAARAVMLTRQGDIGAPAFFASLLALDTLMFSIKGTRDDLTEEITDEEAQRAKEKIVFLATRLKRFHLVRW